MWIKFFKSLLAILTVYSSTLYAASYDCNNASSATEKAICKSERLNSLDERLDYTYRSIQRLVPKKAEVIKQHQLEWIKLRDSTCKNASSVCLESSYNEQIRALENTLSDTIRLKDTCAGIYFNPHIVTVFNGETWEETLVDDVLTFDKLDDQHAVMSLTTISANAHLCYFEGIAKLTADKYIWQTTYYENTQPEMCQLELDQWDSGYLSVKVSENQNSMTDNAIDQACHRYHCGARGTVPVGSVFISAERLLTPGADCAKLRASISP